MIKEMEILCPCCGNTSKFQIVLDENKIVAIILSSDEKQDEPIEEIIKQTNIIFG